MTDFGAIPKIMILWRCAGGCRYPISYDLEEMLAERGISVDHTTILSLGPVLPRRWRSGCAGSGGGFDPSWHRMKPTPVRASGTVPRQSTSGATTRRFLYLSPTRSAKAAKRFPARLRGRLGKACHAQYRTKRRAMVQ